MDAQLKKGFLEYCILAVLCKGDSYGYQMIKDVSTCINISESTLYPILKRLEAGKFLSTYSVEHNSRLRRYHKITPSGRAYLQDFLKQWPQIIDIYEFIKEGAESHE